MKKEQTCVSGLLVTQVASYPPRRTLQAIAHNKMYGCARHNHH